MVTVLLNVQFTLPFVTPAVVCQFTCCPNVVVPLPLVFTVTFALLTVSGGNCAPTGIVNVRTAFPLISNVAPPPSKVGASTTFPNAFTVPLLVRNPSVKVSVPFTTNTSPSPAPMFLTLSTALNVRLLKLCVVFTFNVDPPPSNTTVPLPALNVPVVTEKSLANREVPPALKVPPVIAKVPLSSTVWPALPVKVPDA